VAQNTRPNPDHTFPDVRVPPGGRLTVEAGIGFLPQPPRDEIVIIVRAELGDGRTVARTAALRTQLLG
jgi:hypothetical protein